MNIKQQMRIRDKIRVLYSTLNVNIPENYVYIRDKYDVEEFCMGLKVADQEEIWVLNLNTRHRLVEFTRLYTGTLNTTSVRIGEFFKAAIVNGCADIIIVHNHPSGDSTPSTEDITITKSLIQAGKLLDIEVLDHIVVAQDSTTSCMERLR